MRIRMASAALLTLPLAAQRVQAPDAPWRTLTTAHYRIHFPAGGDFPAFATEVASRIEGIHDRYAGLVGNVHPGPMDVILQDPVLAANGMAFPYPNRPFVVLWKTAPEPDSAIGHHRGWAELLLTHELGHMHHLLWPAPKRGPFDGLVFLPGPLARRAPRWVSEGYATVIEGRLTGSGRPHSAFRAAVLRTWALEGRLPAYGQLNGTGGFLGGNMAYLVGSAYLTWLEAQHGDRPAVLQDLWRHLAGPKGGRFEEAFRATFGYGPEEGYRRFTAEVTHGALEVERRLKAAGLREGEVFTQVDGWVGDLAVSPDGTRLLARVLAPTGPELRVWSLTAPPAPKGDPHPDGAPVAAPRVPRRPPTWRLPAVDGALPWRPAWTRDGQAVAFTLRLPDAEGVLAPEAWSWRPGQGLRRGEAARAEPPAGFGWAADPAIWNLTRTEGGGTTWLTRTPTAAWSPAPTPDGRTLYFARLTATGVEIRRLTLDGPALTPLALDPEGLPFAPGAALSRPDDAPTLPAPVPPPPAHPYAVRESLKAFPLLGDQHVPGDSGLLLGVGFNDILGRLNGQALLAGGRRGDLRGGMAGLAWRGWPVELGFQAFRAEHAPSRQTPESLPGFDRTRTGAEASATYVRQGLDAFRATVRLGQERQAPEGPEPFTRLAGSLDLALRSRRSRGPWGFQGALDGRLLQGRTAGETWQGHRAGAALSGSSPWVDLGVRFESGRLGGVPTAMDRFTLGGPEHSLLPEGLQANQVRQVALPFHLVTGDRFQRWRGELRPGFGTFYVEHLALWDAGTPRPPHLRVAGWELSSSEMGLPMDILQRLLGRLSFSLGVHRVLDGPTRDRTVGTLGVTFRP